MTDNPPPESQSDDPSDGTFPDHDADLDSLANERTLLAWVRTGFALVAAGALVLHLSDYALRSAELVVGLGMIAMGIVTWTTGYLRFRTGELAIARQEPALPLGGVRVVAFAASVSAVCALILAALAG
jgi:putative membrane protein